MRSLSYNGGSLCLIGIEMPTRVLTLKEKDCEIYPKKNC